MISSFFKKTKPINFVIILLAWTISFWGMLLWQNKMAFEDLPILQWISAFIAVIATIFLIEKLVSIYKITSQNHYVIFLFFLLLIWIPEVYNFHTILWSNLFVLIGLGILFRLRNGKNQKESLFNAALCIAIASLFYSWSICYLFLVYVAVAFYCPANIRNWIIPLAGVATVAVLTYSASIIIEDTPWFSLLQDWTWSWNWKIIENHSFLGLFTLLILSGVWFLIRSDKIGSERQIILWVFFYQILTSLLLIFNQYQIENLYFALVPIAVLTSLAIESIPKYIFKELLIWLLLLFPLMLQLTAKG